MESAEMKEKIIRRIRQVLVTLAVQAALLFLAAGTFAWDWGWVYLVTYFVGILINAILLFRANPAVIAERADTEGMRGWDRLWGSLAALVVMLGLPLAGGLDFRLEWSGGMNLSLHLAGVALFFIGGLLFAWAMAVNAKFATVVRVGEEDTHPVAMDGPYRIVRHPGYLGFCIQSIGLPLLFGSWWSFVLTILGIIFMVIRTALEDRTLQAELTGYDQLVARTRYRLIPGAW
jgi:protein-S-isoprenylcysteine O-methyltransferase Ste14